jgi:beta-glucosidase
VNYYFREVLQHRRRRRAAGRCKLGFTDMGWEIFPDGLTELLLKLNAEYELPPIYITENGMANPDTIVNGEDPG